MKIIIILAGLLGAIACSQALAGGGGDDGGGTPIPIPTPEYQVELVIHNETNSPWSASIRCGDDCVDSRGYPANLWEIVPAKSTQTITKTYSSKPTFTNAAFHDRNNNNVHCQHSRHWNDQRRQGNQPCFTYFIYNSINIPITRTDTEMSVTININGVSLTSSDGANYKYGSLDDYSNTFWNQ